ncbi:MAG: transglycosylase domain-containing protein [Bacteroidota bacterium]
METTDKSEYLLHGIKNGRSSPYAVITRSSEIKIAYDHQLSSSFKNFLVEVEDKRFFEHNGIDYKAILRAISNNIKHLSIREGGSTVTQQLARNLLKDNSRTIKRKLTEIDLAIRLEKTYSKNDILQLYFNNVYWGKNIYGIRAAALIYFEKEPHDLNKKEQIKLLTLLRGPNLYLSNSLLFQKRYELLNRVIFRNTRPLKRNIDKKGIKLKSKLSIVNPLVVNFINSNIDNSKKIIYSPIDIDLQNLFSELVKNSKYPTSIVCFYKGELVAFSSHYGTDYPFSFKSNVGSLMKPFLYSFYRMQGINKNEKISTENSSEWHVREVLQDFAAEITLKHALSISNNNVFINAAEKIGMNNVLNHISNLTNKDDEILYPSAILGTSATGMSLYDITKLYHNYFSKISTEIDIEMHEILGNILYEKTNIKISNGFFKSGTTNNNKERFSIFGNKIMTVGILRQNYYENDYSKEGNFISYIRGVLDKIINLKNKWFK